MASAHSKPNLFHIKINLKTIFFWHPFLDAISSSFYASWCQNYGFWDPIGAQLDPEWQSKSPKWRQKAPKIIPSLLLELSWNRPFSKIAPRTFLGIIFNDFGWIFNEFQHSFWSFFIIIPSSSGSAASAVRPLQSTLYDFGIDFGSFWDPFFMKNQWKNRCKIQCWKSHENWWKFDATIIRNWSEINLKIDRLRKVPNAK